jgi:Fe2+ or Zn2+ uptake regulation protein
MASNLKIGNEDNGYALLDEFFKSLMFQQVMDSDLSRNERDVLLVIFRKTIHYEKWNDRISMYWLSKTVGISLTTLRVTLGRLENKSFIDVTRSTGGKTVSSKKYNEFSIHTYLVNMVFKKWEEIKLDNGFDIQYD